MRFISSWTLVLISFSALALPELKTKQSVQNIRYLSPDGKVTYYQKSSGELQFSTNYNFKNVMKLEKNTEYKLNVYENYKKVAIEAALNPFAGVNIQSSHKIYLVEYLGTSKPTYIGEGVDPRIHMEGRIITYYRPEEFSIVVKRGDKIDKVRIVNSHNPSFRPQVFMLSPDTIMYTDINKEGYHAVIYYSLIDKKFDVIYKSSVPSNKLEICTLGDDIYVGSFPSDGYVTGTEILKVTRFTGSLSKSWKSIYTNSLPDIGNMVCKKDFIYFVRTISYDEALRTKSTQIAKISTEGYAKREASPIQGTINYTDLFPLGNLLITSNRGKYYIVEGNAPIESDEL